VINITVFVIIFKALLFKYLRYAECARSVPKWHLSTARGSRISFHLNLPDITHLTDASATTFGSTSALKFSAPLLIVEKPSRIKGITADARIVDRCEALTCAPKTARN